MKIICDKCGKELDKKGAIIHSPPIPEFSYHIDVTAKIHLCVECWQDLLWWLNIK
jgi:hypothetical protein